MIIYNNIRSYIKKIITFKLSKLGIVESFVLFTCFATLIYHLGTLFWIFELFSAFIVQYFLILIIALPYLIYKKSYKILSITSICIIILLIEILPLYYSSNDYKVDKSFKMLSINVHTTNDEFGILKDYIIEQNPDFILLLEVNQNWLTHLKILREQYPYYIESPRHHNFGIAFYSKIKTDDLSVKYFIDSQLPSTVANIKIDDKLLTIIGTHPIAPVRSSWEKVRNSQLDEIGKFVKNIDHNVMVIGDLNTPPWSVYFKKLEIDASLINSQKGFGVSPSWPTFPFFLLTPIDHCLVSKNIKVIKRTVGKNVGSDHYPLIVDFGIKEKYE